MAKPPFKPSKEWLAQAANQTERTFIKTNVPAEWLVLRAMCVSARYIEMATEVVNPEMFTCHMAVPVARIFWEMVNVGSGISLMSFKTFAQKKHTDKEVFDFIENLKSTGEAFSIRGVEYNTQSGFDKQSLQVALDDIRGIWIRQNLADLGTYQLTALKSDDLDAYAEHERKKDEILAGRKSVVRNALQAFTDFENVTLETMKRREAGEVFINGELTQYTAVDSYLLGMEPGDLLIVAARPGMGKTAFVTQIMGNNAKQGIGVGLISLEMKETIIVRRITAQQTRIEMNDFRSGCIAQSDLHLWGVMSGEMKKWPLFFDDVSMKWSEVEQSIIKMVKQNGCRMIVVDYLQLVDSEMGKGANGNVTVGYISLQAKRLAKRLGIPIIMLSQLSRAVETRGGTKRPQLSDLRDSGSIEQDADTVIFLYRPEYYSILEDEEGHSLKNVLKVIIAKSRNGALGEVDLMFDGPTNRISDTSNQLPDQTPF